MTANPYPRCPMPPTDPPGAAAWLALFAEPTRLHIVRLLAAGARTVTELAKATRAEVVNVSHHLKLLKAAGLVTDTRDGRFRVYALAGGSGRAGDAAEHAEECGDHGGAYRCRVRTGWSIARGGA